MTNKSGAGHLFGSLRLASEDVTPELVKYLAAAQSHSVRTDLIWSASWLLSDWNASIWLTTAGDKTRKNEFGRWVGTCNVGWDITMPDGMCLASSKYTLLLETARRASFLFRQGMANDDPPSLRSWIGFNELLLKLCQWLVLYHERYNPAREGMRFLDSSGVKNLLEAIARGGWCEALSLIERCLSGVYFEVFNKKCPDSLLVAPWQWPGHIREAVVLWLKVNGKYVTKASGRTKCSKFSLISKDFICRCASMPVRSGRAFSRLNNVLRQFEPGVSDFGLITSRNLRTEFPSKSVGLLGCESIKTSSASVIKSSASNLINLTRLHSCLPEYFPSGKDLEIKSAKISALRLASGSSHTPFIPIDSGMRYLNEAMRWVILYGDSLVEYYLNIIEQFASLVSSPGKKLTWGYVIYNYSSRIFAETPLPESLRLAGFVFTRFSIPKGGAKDFDRLRQQPSLHDALEVYVGAVVTLISILKPSRDSEIVDLPRACVLRTELGGYWLDSDLAKRTKAERRARTGGKPIPSIVAQAIQQVRKLNRGLVKVFDETDIIKRSKLFYLPNPADWGEGKDMKRTSLNSYLDRFCDYVALPTDEYGRRWYLRIHHARKWFLILLYWSGRYDVLDAARWMAGHTDISHVYAYVEREFPSELLGQLEATCAVDRLAEYDTTRVTIEEQDVGLVELYQRVLDHFQVEKLSMVQEREWTSMVGYLFKNNYHLEPFEIVAGESDSRICIAIRQGERGR